MPLAPERGTQTPRGESHGHVRSGTPASPSAHLVGTPPHMSDRRTSSSTPWWAEVEHLRTSRDASRHDTLSASSARRSERHAAPAAPAREHARASQHQRRRSVERPDWFAQEARSAGRRAAPAPVEPARPSRPRVTLVDVAPAHALTRRAPQTRRRAGERPTVTITGRPDAALPPRPAAEVTVRAPRTRERVSSVVHSPDRMILWAVALGILMIVASIATGTAGA